ncbi:hypothetical protein K2173_025186 [Erythroxylum novogranatense]|uniref:BZIP domain-containing protein n=1 Tax=Erythroxylum novogranatense TaxID=1862640 RepID=A0AAV8UD41_9ROSI|nr:hypothetical protein K2173_025186 [Erythroxylum novogranatense]
MSAVQKQTASSSSDSDPRYANVDERKRKRMISNRESARRSRARKQKLMEDFMKEADQLKSENNHLEEIINTRSQYYVQVESDNNVLRAQAMELTERLASLNSVLHLCQEVNGYSLDIPEIPDPLLKPWQLPFPGQPIMASADLLL